VSERGRASRSRGVTFYEDRCVVVLALVLDVIFW